MMYLSYFQGLTLNLNSSARTMKSDNNLVLQRVTRNVAGKYACRATNSEGESFSNELSLRIKCKCSGNNNGHEGFVLQIVQIDSEQIQHKTSEPFTIII